LKNYLITQPLLPKGEEGQKNTIYKYYFFFPLPLLAESCGGEGLRVRVLYLVWFVIHAVAQVFFKPRKILL